MIAPFSIRLLLLVFSAVTEITETIGHSKSLKTITIKVKVTQGDSQKKTVYLTVPM